VQYLSSFTLSLILLQLLIGTSPTYITLLGMLGLGIEAVLPIPQFITHYRRKSVSGFRPSVIVAWLLGDIFKCSYFFLGGANVGWQFKACALVQISFDLGIAVQFCVYGERQAWSANGSVGKHIEEELEDGLVRRWKIESMAGSIRGRRHGDENGIVSISYLEKCVIGFC
jgi:hypothetical protein